MKNTCIILNPVSGHGRGLRSLPALQHALAEAGVAYDLLQSQYSGHAIQLARQAALEGCPVVAAAGGEAPSMK